MFAGPFGQLLLVAEPSLLPGEQRGDGKRFVVRADEKLTAFVELEWAIRRVSGGKLHKIRLDRMRVDSA